MATNLQAGAVAVKIDVDQRQFNAAFVNMQNTFNQFNNDMRSFSNTITDSFNTTTPGFTGFAAFLRDASVTAAALGHVIRKSFEFIGGFVTDFATFGDQFTKLSQKTGIGAKDLSLLGYAADQCGTSVAELGTGLKLLAKNGSKANISSLGIDFAKFQKLSKIKQFRAIAEAIKNIGDETKQAQATMKLFGKGGVDLLPMLQEGEGGIAKLMNEAEGLGIGISDEDAKNATELDDAMNRLQQTWKGLKNTIGSFFAPILTFTLDGITNIMKSLRGLGAYFETFYDNIVNKGYATFTVIQRIFSVAKSVFMNLYGDAFALIQKGDFAAAIQMQWLKAQLILEQAKQFILNTFAAASAAAGDTFTPLWDAIVEGWKYVTEAFATG